MAQRRQGMCRIPHSSPGFSHRSRSCRRRSASLGFVLWTGVNLLGALVLAWRIAQLFPGAERLWVALLLFTSFPVVVTLFAGQPILLACAVAECYLSLRAGRDFRAGLWLSCLVLKPQYGFLIGPLLIWKRRWSAVAGALVGAAAVMVGSALARGLPALLA
jgi:hypothetical protein